MADSVTVVKNYTTILDEVYSRFALPELAAPHSTRGATRRRS